MEGKWRFNCRFMGCYFRNLLKTARNILVQFSFSFFSQRFVRVLVVLTYSSTDTATPLKNSHVILSEKLNFQNQ